MHTRARMHSPVLSSTHGRTRATAAAGVCATAIKHTRAFGDGGAHFHPFHRLNTSRLLLAEARASYRAYAFQYISAALMKKENAQVAIVRALV